MYNNYFQHFGEKILKITIDAWVEGVAWSPSGNQLVAVSHDRKIKVWTFQDEENHQE